MRLREIVLETCSFFIVLTVVITLLCALELYLPSKVLSYVVDIREEIGGRITVWFTGGGT